MKKTTQTHQALKKIARNIFWFHLIWIFAVIVGTVVECFYPPYAKIQVVIVAMTIVFQMLGSGHCPLTLFENLVLKECDPEKMYCDKETYDVSFVRYCLKKYLGITAPKGTTTLMLLMALMLTIVIFLKTSFFD